ncbi:copper chaperone PCu(A)C [Erythrobacter sp. SDW2]|uniref:copper chaperone PCu(A)C n=1 Tax=Erythrobacter sp. SDW2 TaxID=2907154 RepID=UPI001F366AB0|nr:copper chaperone PCu(A)C [Erythrobacter sp. SDW2]UIP05789.1 copper chaperone PCu(A)C [Erythrobacter sp. SDW2]
MNHTFAALAFGLAAFTIGGCQNEPRTATEHEAAPVSDTGIEGLTVAKAHLMMPAVAGNPAGLFFDVSYSGTDELTLESADIAQSQATTIHDVVEKDGMTQMVALGPLLIKAGDAVSFAPGGKHVMAMKLDEAVAPGSKVDVTLTFAGGKTAKFTADVMPAGETKMEH